MGTMSKLYEYKKFNVEYKKYIDKYKLHTSKLHPNISDITKCYMSPHTNKLKCCIVIGDNNVQKLIYLQDVSTNEITFGWPQELTKVIYEFLHFKKITICYENQ